MTVIKSLTVLPKMKNVHVHRFGLISGDIRYGLDAAF